jgi:cytoskeletal protein RodZ
MILLILEAFLALFILVGIVWWTMFSGRQGGEIRSTLESDNDSEKQTPSS